LVEAIPINTLGKDVTVDVRRRLVLDEMRAVLGAACQGSGLGLVFRQFATAEIASGAVLPILDQFLPSDQPFHLYYANRAHTPSKLRAFIEFMQAANRTLTVDFTSGRSGITGG